jgi:dienelactone hydrolase
MIKKFFIALGLVLVVVLGLFFLKWEHNMPRIIVTPEKSFIDEPVKISISNLSPHEHLTLEASCTDKKNNTWSSRAVFEADANGMVHVATQAPVSGSYQGVDPMGLFWSMTPPNKKVSSFSYKKKVPEILLSVFSQNKLIAQKTICRLLISPDIEKRHIHEDGVIGTLFYPKNMQSGPGIIVIPGSNGGIPEGHAQLLVSHGYAVLALGYFAAKGLPDTLENIPLEYFQNAIQWFKKQSQVDENRIALRGASRGGELVLLLAATFPNEINAVIAYVPSNLVYGGVPKQNEPAWTYKNIPIPFMPSPNDEEFQSAAKEGNIPFHKGTFEDPYEITINFLYGMKKFSQNIKAATIPVENIRCPILILSGEDDKLWPSTLYGNRIMERLDKKKSTIERKHVHFSGAGHMFSVPYIPSISLPSYNPLKKSWSTLGGTTEDNAKASKESYKAVLNFLEKTLKLKGKLNGKK